MQTEQGYVQIFVEEETRQMTISIFDDDNKWIIDAVVPQLGMIRLFNQREASCNIVREK
jgi:hypothetical protein